MRKSSLKNKLSFSYVFKWISFKLSKLLYPRYKHKWVVLYRYTKALGDNLFLGTMAHEIKKRNPDAVIHVITGLPVLFKGNPDVDFVSEESTKPLKNIGNFLLHYEHNFPWKKNILHYCLNQVGIKNVSNESLKTYIYPTKEDFAFAQKLVAPFSGKKIIAIATIAGPRTDKKNWPIAYWKYLVEMLLRDGYVVVKTGLSYPEMEDIEFRHNNFLDLSGRTSIHQSAALLSMVNLLVCPITGILHLAAAYNLKTLAIAGGSEPGVATQYPNGYYIENRPLCANCYEKGACNFNHICLHEIKPMMVYDKIRLILNT